MNYSDLIKRSWEIMRAQRWLWWLGFLAMWTEGGLSLGYFGNFGSGPTFPEPMSSPTPTPSVSPSPTASPSLEGAAAGVTNDFDPVAFKMALEKFSSFVTDNWIWLLISALLGLALFILLMYISHSARAGLIRSVQSFEEDNKKLGFGKAYHLGRQYAWRLFGYDVVVGLITVAIFAVFVGITVPLVLVALATSSLPLLITTGAFGVIGFLLALLLELYLSIVRLLASRALVIHDLGMVEAFKRGHQMLRRQPGNVLLTALVTIGFNLLFSMAVVVVALPVIAILVGIGAVLFAVGPVALFAAYVVLAVLAFLALMFFLSSLYVTFHCTFWTLAYRALEYLGQHKQK